jgi:lipopolysaccharide biosynthesis glycosyltransferase
MIATMKQSEKSATNPAGSRHFLFGCDANMLEPLVVVWSGIWRHMEGQDLVFHLRAVDVAPCKIERCKAWCGKRGIILRIYDYSGIAMQGPGTHPFPESATVRLVPLQELHAVGERLLYLDADVIVLGDLSPLFEIPLHGYPCAACHDPVVVGRARKQALGTPPDAPHFNSGVIVFDVPVWKRERISERAQEYLQQNAELCAFADQDALNAVLCGRYFPLEERYNRFARLGESTRDWREGRWAIVHFTGRNKPWQLEHLEPRHFAKAAYYWSQAGPGWYPWRTIALLLGLKNRFNRVAAGWLATMSRWRQRMTPSWLEEGYCRLRFVLTRGKWK